MRLQVSLRFPFNYPLNESESSVDNYRVTRMVAEKIMLTSKSKFRQRPGQQTNLTAKRNFKFGVNINYSATIRVTL